MSSETDFMSSASASNDQAPLLQVTQRSSPRRPARSPRTPHPSQEPFDGATLVLRPLEPVDLQAASVCLTRSFAGSPEQVGFKDVSQYLDKMLTWYPDAVMLVARLTQPADATATVGTWRWDRTPPAPTYTLSLSNHRCAYAGPSSRLVGLVGLSFSSATREHFK